MTGAERDRWSAWSADLVAAARGLNVLGRLSWSEAQVEAAIASIDAGAGLDALPPAATVDVEDLRPQAEALRAARDDIAGEEPVPAYLRRTATSYLDAIALLEAAGTARLGEVSARIYGSPRDVMPGSARTHADAAARLLEVTGALDDAARDEAALYCVPAAVVAERMRPRLDAVFGTDPPLAVVLDAALAAKAAAGVDRVRLRDKTCFADSDVDSLLHHEAFVHTATAKNGRAQPWLPALGVGAPRTTGTQEGLATFAELITGSMDINRLRRLALRILAVDRAMQGADFVEVARFFVEHGQSLDEGVRSAMRVFRGVPLAGGAAFTKDVVYLHGLIAVHTFLRLAIEDGQLALIPRLFAGRLTLGDVLALGPSFDAGDIAPGRFLPSWARDPRRLAAYLAFSLVVGQIDLGAVSLRDFTEPAEG